MASPRYIDADQLCIGLSIELDIDWLEHPFPFNRFKIKSKSQIEALQQLGIKRIRFNPGRSDAQPLPSTRTPEEILAEIEAAETGSDDPEKQTDEHHELNREKLLRLQKIKAQHAAVDACEKNFRAAAKAISSIHSNMFAQPQACLERAKILVDAMVAAAIADRDISLTLMNNKIASGEVYDHAMNVLVLSIVVGQQIGMTDIELRSLGIAAMFHDIGKKEISPTIVNKPPPLSAFELKTLQTHVHLGAQMGVKLGIDPAVLKVMSQHHERANGTGYPRGLTDDAITVAGRILCVVNDYDNLCNPVNPLSALTPHEALKFMYSKRLKEYSPMIISQFIRSMGIYPAGTLVAMSNGMQGLVLQVNTDRPLKPTVMIYDGTVPRRDAIILDLNDEPDVTIERALKKTDLSLEAVAYLNPRNRVAYFTQET